MSAAAVGRGSASAEYRKAGSGRLAPMSSDTDPRDRLDEIYGGEPAAFTKGRDALAKELKDAGEGELAAEVKRLKRPTKAAAAINRLSLAHGEETGRVLEMGSEL